MEDDVLSVLRRYHIQKKEIVTEGDAVIFGELSWPRSAKTNYVVSGTGKKGQPRDYYTLDSVLFLLGNARLTPQSYVRRAAAEGVPVVRKPDRKAMMSYLGGEGPTPTSVDGSAGPETAPQRATIAPRKREAGEAVLPGAKRTRDEDQERLEGHKDVSHQFASLPGATSVESECSAVESDLDDVVVQVRFDGRTPVEGGTRVENAFDSVVTPREKTGSVHALQDTDVTGGIVSRERVWSSRTSVLQSVAEKDFSKSILAIVRSVRATEKKEEERRQRPPGQQNTARADHPSSVAKEKQSDPADYARFDRSMSTGKREGLNVNATVGSYHDTTSTSATEGASGDSNNKTPTPPASPRPVSSSRPVSRAGPPTDPPKNQSDNNRHASRTPIVVVPAGATSLITVANVRDLLQELTFVTSEEKRRREEGVVVPPRGKELLLQRRKKEPPRTRPAGSEGTTTAAAAVPYRVTDQPLRLSPRDWEERVVAVFVQGPAWQFKGWPGLRPDGSPADIFARIPAFHLRYDDVGGVGGAREANVRRWNVAVLEVSRHRRHLDRIVFRRFWETLDRHMAKHKAHLRF